MKLLELEPTPKDREETGVLNTEDEVGNKPPVGVVDEEGTDKPVPVGNGAVDEEGTGKPDPHGDGEDAGGSEESFVGAASGRPPRRWHRIWERFGEYVGWSGFGEEESDDLDGDGAVDGEGTGKSVPHGDGVEDEEGTGKPDPHGDGAVDQRGNALAGGPAVPGHVWRAEWVMVAIAFLAAGVLGVTAAFCKPYFDADEDPMELPSYYLTATEPGETFLEPEETEPKIPTIPPDPNPYDRFDFQYNRHNYLLLQNVESFPGVDVSAYQGDIDWEQVAASGIRFAIVRLGYRGYGSGKLVEDEYARANLEGASDAGLQVGAYFFSQALNQQEVDEEIEFLLEILGEHYLDMPVILDWEIPTADARTAGKMDARSLTDLQLHFCREMKERGYQPMVYFNWHQSEELYLLSELEEYPFWLALYQDRMTYPWKVEMWQYSCTGRVPGIQGDVDLNVYMP